MKSIARSIPATWNSAPSGSERQLLAAAKAGDRGAFDVLVSMHSDPLRRFVSRRVPPSAIDDVMQDTWISAWNHCAKYVERARFRTWLMSIALNKCHDWHRQDRPAITQTEIEDTGISFSQLDLAADLEKALSALCPGDRELIDLYYFERMSMPEIARLLGRNLNTLKYQFYRAHRVLAEHLEDPS
jgi:RNA polymerase sigma-70 factor (ECF subfamily)